MRTLTFSSSGGECCNPTLRECEDETHTPEMGTWESFETPETLDFDYRGQNTSHWGVLYIIRKLSKCRCRKWAIWTSVAHVMAKRRAGSQTDNLTPGH
jgi:hypothetical protein